MKILIIKTSALGDILHIFPVIAYLRNRFPHALLEFVVEERCKDLVTSHPFLDRLIIFNSKNRSFQEFKKLRDQLKEHTYDLVFDLQGNCKSSLILFLTKAKQKIGFKHPREWPNRLFTNVKIDPRKQEFSIYEEYLSLVQQFFSDTLPFEPPKLPARLDQAIVDLIKDLPRPLIAIAPSSTWENKNLSREQWLSLLKKTPRVFSLHPWFSFRGARGALSASPLFRAFSSLRENISLFPFFSLYLSRQSDRHGLLTASPRRHAWHSHSFFLWTHP